MKTTLADLLSPSHDHYRSLGELARTLQHFMSTDKAFRQTGRWGSSGPRETLANYEGCTNSHNKCWHSGRMTQGCTGRNTTSWQENHDSVYNCLLASICRQDDLFKRWRATAGIDLYMRLKFPMAYQIQDEEKAAWDCLMALHAQRLPHRTFNGCHRGTNVLAAPELIIGPAGVTVSISLTLRSELRSSPDCFSRWNACFLTQQDQPRWNCQRETFSKFILRAVDFYKTLQPNLDRTRRIR